MAPGNRVARGRNRVRRVSPASALPALDRECEGGVFGIKSAGGSSVAVVKVSAGRSTALDICDKEDAL
jgi:hypothetical protein